jgi:hypothetical protein
MFSKRRALRTTRLGLAVAAVAIVTYSAGSAQAGETTKTCYVSADQVATVHVGDTQYFLYPGDAFAVTDQGLTNPGESGVPYYKGHGNGHSDGWALEYHFNPSCWQK